MKLDLGMVGIAAAIGVCIGCGLGCNSAASRRPAVGTWVFDPATSAFPDVEQGALVRQQGSNIVYRFKPNGSFTEEPGNIAGSYRVDGNRVILQVASFGGRKIGSKLDSGLLFLSDDGGHLAIYSRYSPPEIIGLAKVRR
jgi:hypothetical protein